MSSRSSGFRSDFHPLRLCTESGVDGLAEMKKISSIIPVGMLVSQKSIHARNAQQMAADPHVVILNLKWQEGSPTVPIGPMAHLPASHCASSTQTCFQQPLDLVEASDIFLGRSADPELFPGLRKILLVQLPEAIFLSKRSNLRWEAHGCE
mmetsp:Transcript_28296/g.44127  ORF Transcript_28296/g.44127 Transcript_28296/m.44127 type:complete len:151 (+) Transcript_28296:292-744(+)